MPPGIKEIPIFMGMTARNGPNLCYQIHPLLPCHPRESGDL